MRLGIAGGRPRSDLLLAVLAGAVVVGCGGSRDRPPKAAEAAAVGAAEAAASSASGKTGSRPETRIVVNGVALSDETVRQLQQVYPVEIAPGRYWYDVVSGAWGRDGEPVAGQMLPGLALGGPLAANASRGRSGVFINGRQLTDGEKAYLEQLCQTPVVPGRYWVMANGVGGFEGGAAYFNLAQCPGVARQGGGGRSMSRTFCDPNGACTSTGILGSITTAGY
jgi:hypothetical protein